MVTREEFMFNLKEYFDSGVLSEVLYNGNNFCVINYGNKAYAICPYMIAHNGGVFGIPATVEAVKIALKDERLLLEQFKSLLENEPRTLYHFNKENFKVYFDFMNDKNNKVCFIDENFNEELRSMNKNKVK